MPLKLIPPTPGRSKVFRVRGTHRGVYLDRSTGLAREAGARALLRKWEQEIERGELDGKPRLTFAEAMLAFVQAGGEKRFLAPILKHFGAKVAAADIDQAAVDAAAELLYPQGKPSTRNRQVYAPISAILRHNGVGFDMKRPKGAQGRRRSVWLTPDEFERVSARAAEIDAGLGAMIVLGCYTGMRLGEILAIRRCDVNLEAGELIVPRTKNGDPRLVHLPPRARAALAAFAGADVRPAEARLFRFTKNGALNKLAHRAYAAAGVDCGDAPFHVLRHTWATWMVRAGADLVATKAWRSQTSARVYTHFVVSEEAKKADTLPGASHGFRTD